MTDLPTHNSDPQTHPDETFSFNFSPYTECNYVARKGVCGRRCFGNRCFKHRKTISLNYCLGGCNKGTSSKTGYCSSCGRFQNTICNRIRLQKLKHAKISSTIAALQLTLQELNVADSTIIDEN
jgi:hypothetical protein